MESTDQINLNQKPDEEQKKSLYVGDLPSYIEEHVLFKLFNTVGPVNSIYICRDANTKMPLGHAYINYHNHEDASKAFSKLRFARIYERDIRLMWSQRNNEVRKRNIGNLYIKNLHHSVDNKALYDSFSAFGKILSCKVAYDEDHNSKGYGFVHFENAASAQQAITKLNNNEIASKKVTVCPFKPRNERLSSPMKFTNLYVKNFAKLIKTEEQFREFFQKYGKITSIYFPLEENSQTSKGFAFVNFDTPEDAQSAVDKLHGTEPNHFYVTRALNKAERQHMLRKSFENWRAGLDAKTSGRNLYVKNLPAEVNEDQLSAEFANYGVVESVRIKRDSAGASKGFGFVLMSTRDEAAAAIRNIHGKMWNNKELFVSLWQRKEVRRQQFGIEQANKKFRQPSQYQMYPTQQVIYGAPQQMAAQPMIFNTQPLQSMPFHVGRMQNGTPAVHPMAPMNAASMNASMNAPMNAQYIQAPMAYAGEPQMNAQAMLQSQMNAQYSVPQQMYVDPKPQMVNTETPIAQNINTRPNFDHVQQIALPENAESSQNNADALAHHLGEQIYERVSEIDKERAGKITGMFLEMKQENLMDLLQNEQLFERSVIKAIELLDQEE